jgi:rsbT co-antagonist protein RsbR
MANEMDELTMLRGRVAELEAKLAERDTYARFFENSLAMFSIADTTGRLLHLNQAWERTLGWTVEELYVNGVFPLIHPDDLERSLVANQALLDGKPAFVFENRYRTKDGDYRHFRSFASPVDAKGTMYALTVDITEQRIAEERARVYEDTIVSSATGMFVLQVERRDDPASLRLLMANEAAEKFTGVPLRAELGRLFVEVFPNAVTSGLSERYTNIAQSGGVLDLGEVSYGDDRVEQSFFAVKAFGLPGDRVCVNFENITERKRAEEDRLRAVRQDEVIRAQAAALAELSTPLIPVSDDVVVMPLIGTVDPRRAEQVLDTLLSGIASRRAGTAILDITGVSSVDTQTAEALLRAARAAKLLGAQVMLTGIRPDVARMFVELGVDLTVIRTYGSLQAGIAAALNGRRG